VSSNRWLVAALLGGALLAGLILDSAICVATGKEAQSYPFTKTPTDALAAVAVLRSEHEPVAFEPGAAERALSEWFHHGKLTDDQWAEAFLIASGETDPQRREKLVQQLAQLTDSLRHATKGLSPRKTAERLLKELHAGPMAKGYDLHQSSLASLLRTGKHNCVSSTVLYQLQARRLGLKVQAIEFPGYVFEGHVLTLLIDGPNEIDIETTNPDGFDCRRKIKEAKAITTGIRDLKDGQRIEDVSLLLSLYGNRTVEAAKAGRQFDALRLSLVMLSLHPENKQSQQLVEGAFMNWVRKLDDAKQFARALQVGRVGLDLMPKSTGLTKNLKASHQQCAGELIAAGKDSQVLELYAAAHQHWPKDDYQKGPANAFMFVAQELRRDKGWDAALPIIQRGLQQLTENGELHNFVCYAAQKHLEELDEKQGPTAAVAWFEKTRANFPTAKELLQVAELHVARTYNRLASRKHFAAARASILEREQLITPQQADYFIGLVYDDEARDFCSRKEWVQASEVYRVALAQLPQHEVLVANAPLVFARRAEYLMDQKAWREAIKIYDLGLQSFPDCSLFKQNIRYCERMLTVKN
jgi:tetratricopeptide (TPR) repeat protein